MLPYEKDLDGAALLRINEQFLATISSPDVNDGKPVSVQLEDADEAARMVAEFEDMEGDLMHKEDSVFGKYEDLYPFRP